MIKLQTRVAINKIVGIGRRFIYCGESVVANKSVGGGRFSTHDLALSPPF